MYEHNIIIIIIYTHVYIPCIGKEQCGIVVWYNGAAGLVNMALGYEEIDKGLSDPAARPFHFVIIVSL